MLANAALAALTVLAVRGTPFLLYLIVSQRHGLRTRAVALVVASALFCCSTRAFGESAEALLVACLSTVLLFSSAAGFVFLCVRMVPRMRPVVAFGLFVLVFVAIPASLAVRGLIPILGVTIGWEMLLSAHSYRAEHTRSRALPRVRDCFFFLLVNPVVVYGLGEYRGRTSTSTVLVAVSRIALGASLVAGRGLALSFLSRLVPFVPLTIVARDLSTVSARLIWTVLVLGLGLYAAHSGLAHIQIGMMRLIGYDVPERYQMPILARNPQTFWARWNTWVALWARRYLYFPLARSLTRVDGWSLKANGQIGILATFIVMGVLHDLGIEALRAVRQDTSPRLSMTCVFVCFGLVSIVWNQVASTRSISAVADRVAPRVAQRMAMLALLLVMSFLGLLSLPGRGGMAEMTVRIS